MDPLVVFGGISLSYAFSPLSWGQWEFIEIWDDQYNFRDNELLNQRLSWHTLWLMLTSTRINVYEPVAWLSKALVLTWFGLNSHPIRILSLGTHLLSSCILAKASTNYLSRIFDPTYSSYVTKASVASTLLVFSLHPVHAEVIAWPSAQSYTAAGFFASIAFWAYIEAQHNRSLVYLTASIVAYGLAVLCKSAVLMLPVGFVCLDFATWKNTPAGRSYIQGLRSFVHQQIISKLGYAIIFLVMIGITFAANKDGTSQTTDTIFLDPTERGIKALEMVWWSIHALVWPGELRLHYQVRHVELDIATSGSAVLSCIGTLLITCLCGVLVERMPGFLAAWIYFVAMFVPTCGIVQHGMVAKAADRYVYLPSLGLIPAVAYVLVFLLVKLRSWTQGSRTILFFLVAIMVTWAELTSRQISAWRTEESIYRHALQQDPTDWRILDTYAEFLMLHERQDECEPYWRKTLLYIPSTGIKATLMRAKLELFLGNTDFSCSLYEKSEELYPTNIHLLNNLAICALKSGNLNKADEFFGRALRSVATVDLMQTAKQNYELFVAWKLRKKEGKEEVFRPRLMW